MLRRIYDWCIDAAHKPYALWIMGAVAFAESSFFPVPPDVMLIPMSLARPQRAWLYALVCTASSVVGGILGYAIGALLYDSIGQWLINLYGLGDKVEAFRAGYAEYGAWIILLKGLTPIPYKLVTITSGFANYNIWLFIGLSVIARGGRFFMVAILLNRYGEWIRIRIEKRLGLWVALGAGALLAGSHSLGGGPAANAAPRPVGTGYGTDPDLVKGYKPGDLWPLTFSAAQRRQVAALCDVVIPADGSSPSASAVGVTDFIDEFVSAPYPDNVTDGKKILEGLEWLDAESMRRYGAVFAEAAEVQRASLCEDISRDDPGRPGLKPAADFFRRFRNVVAGGFYTTPEGMRDIGYVGNVPLARFDGPPAGLVEKLGLTDEVKW